MKKFNTTLWLNALLSWGVLMAQGDADWYPVEIVEEIITFQVIEEGGRLSLKLQSRDDRNKLIEVQEPFLMDADIVIKGEPILPSKKLNYRIIIKWVHPATDQLLGKQELIGEEGESTPSFTLTFKDATEEGLYLGQSYQLQIEKQLLSTVNCQDPRPEYLIEKQLPPLGLISLGLVATGIGEGIYGLQQRKDYSKYQLRWKNGEVDDAGLLTSAQSAKNTRRWLNVGGAVAMMTGGIWWWLERRKIKQKQKMYDTYCQPDLSLIQWQPIMITDGIGLIPGIQLTYKIR